MKPINESEPVDIVLPWVDGSDPAWQKERDHWAKQEVKDPVFQKEQRDGAGEERFRDWGLMRYFFRGIEKCLPWIRKVHFVTWGHVPEWLDTTCPKLAVVRHEDYIPEKYLPTFNSNTIELFAHRIPGLAERFLHFNDDLFVLQPIKPETYFKNGLPRDYALLNARSVETGDFFFTPMINDAVVNSLFSKKETVRRHRNKWYAPCYGVFSISNLMLMRWTNFTGFVDGHLITAYRKPDIEKAWELAGHWLEETCSHKFRRNTDVSIWLARYIRLCRGEFLPKKCDPLDTMFSFEIGEEEVLKRCCTFIRNQSRPCICINDGSKVTDFARDRELLEQALLSRYPNKSSFERA